MVTRTMIRSVSKRVAARLADNKVGGGVRIVNPKQLQRFEQAKAKRSQASPPAKKRTREMA